MSGYNATSGLFKELNSLGIQGIQFLTSGNVFFVDSGATQTLDKIDGIHGLSWEFPFATIDFAVSACEASNSDVIYVAAGHTEAVITDGGITLDVVGISVIGMGKGSLRPTITVGATSGEVDTVLVSAASVTVKNMIFTIAAVDVTAIMEVNADDFLIEDCEFRMHITSFEAVSGISLSSAANAADRCTIRNCNFMAAIASDTTYQAIELGEVNDRVVIDGVTAIGDFAAACIHNPTGKVLTFLTIENCTLYQSDSGSHCIELVSACTGMLIRNNYHTDMAQATAVDSGSCFSIECYHCDVVDTSGVLCPAAT